MKRNLKRKGHPSDDCFHDRAFNVMIQVKPDAVSARDFA